MDTVKLLKIALLGVCLTLIVTPLGTVHAQAVEEEEEEELLQARPNPMERSAKGMRGRTEMMRGSGRPGGSQVMAEDEEAQTMPNPAGRATQMRGMNRMQQMNPQQMGGQLNR